VLPLYQVSSPPFGRSLISTPFAVHGGICADDDEAAGALLEDAAALARRLGCRYVELRHERPVADLPTKDLYVTFRRAILPDREANLAAIPSNKRHRVRNSEKRGLTARLGGAELLPGYYRVISESMRNLGSPVFPKRLFRALLEEFGARCRIFSVFHDETMVAGALTLFYRDQVIPYYGGSTRTGNSLAANDFMYWKLLCHGAEAGYKIFDFGRSKKESGAYGFKRHWGFEPTPLAYQYQLTGQRDLPNLSPANPKFSLAIHLWRRMPLRLTQWLGPQLVRYFP
jgi:FemAB-related protein (PEP-CTERM system-associated)